MFERTFITVAIFVFFCAYCYHCIQVIPDRTSIKYCNDKYGNITANVRRSSRRGDYVFNMDIYSKISVDNNITIKFLFYEYRSKYNQYSRIFFQLNFKVCDLILHDSILGYAIRKASFTRCPIPPGYISLTNMTFNQDIPYDPFGFDQGKIEVMAKNEPSKEMLVNFDVFFHIVRKQAN